MDLIDISADFEHGKPLIVTGGRVPIPPEYIDEHEIIYRVRRAPDMEQGDILIIEPRNTAATGELVIAFQGPRAYIGHWWAKHGLRELRSERHEPIIGEFQIAKRKE